MLYTKASAEIINLYNEDVVTILSSDITGDTPLSDVTPEQLAKLIGVTEEHAAQLINASESNLNALLNAILGGAFDFLPDDVREAGEVADTIHNRCASSIFLPGFENWSGETEDDSFDSEW